MTDQTDHGDEPQRRNPEPAAPEPAAPEPAAPQPAAPQPPATGRAGTRRPDAAGPGHAASALAGGSAHYRDLAIARRLRAARASLGAAVRPATAPAAPGTVPSAGPDGGSDRAAARADAVTTAPGSVPRWALRRPEWAGAEVRIAAVLLALLLAGAVAAALPEGAATTRPELPGELSPDPGIQVPAATIERPATTAPGKGTGPVGDPVGGGQLQRAPGSGGPQGGDTPVHSPTSWRPSPSQPATPPVSPPRSTLSPSTTIPQQTTTSAVPTSGPPGPTGTTAPDPPPTS